MEPKKIDKAFSEVFHNNLWGGDVSKSGPGSDLEQTRVIRTAIVDVIKKYNIKSMIDAPCGDFYWMKELVKNPECTLESYIGIDIVEDLIKKNNEQHGSSRINFISLNLAEQKIPIADLILTRDCFIHLSFSNIFKILKNHQQSGAAYVLISTYVYAHRKNVDVDGFYIHGRALNMQKFPFSLPEPILLINEACTEGNGAYADKSLGLWKPENFPLNKILINLMIYRMYSFPYQTAKKIYKTIFRK